jgi:putative transposase
MREWELAARRPRHRTKTTQSDPRARVAPNRLDRDFTATRPNEKWTGDTTAIWTYEGWLYLAAVLDLFSRRVGGWAMAASADEALVEMALRKLRPQAGLLHHTDRGCQDTSTAYQALLAEKSMTVSMSRKGNCWDNAVTESFFGTLTSECVDLMCCQTRASARQTVFELVKCYYNRVRRHSSLGYVSPAPFEQQMC